MRPKFIFCVFSFLLFSPLVYSWDLPSVLFPQQNEKLAVDNGGGGSCAACVILTTLAKQLASPTLFSKVCRLFPDHVSNICDYYVNMYGGTIVRILTDNLSPDAACQAINFCTNRKCALWPTESKRIELASVIEKERLFHLRLQKLRVELQSNPWDWILKLLDPLIKRSVPVLDFDNDKFSFERTLRGSNWRGRDCDDSRADVYPGRRASVDNVNDYNCNGIFSKDNINYKEMYCKNSSQYGVVVLGDSAAAHFSIPSNYFNATEINYDTYKGIISILSNEFDWPMQSATTGYVKSSKFGPVNSLYKVSVERNPCNHRDYQNIARNGLRSGSALELARSIARNSSLDHPVLLAINLIGNDVCSPHHTTDKFTPVAVFKQNILNILNHLETILPRGSHVFFIGLAQGSALYDRLHNRIHPLGVTYSRVYDFLNCLYANPCWTWMNSNATIREMGDKHAAALSAVYPQIIREYKFTKFDMVRSTSLLSDCQDYYPFPLDEITEIWTAQGGEPWQLIEVSDGFHPNQIANSLMAQYMTKRLLKDHPDWLGPVNPHASKIKEIFGDQGGY